LLAKILVVAPDREVALARARRAIDELETGGLQTTQPFHAWLLGQVSFREGRLRTDLVERDWEPAALRAGVARRAAEVAARHVWDSAATTTAVVRSSDQTPGAATDAATAWREAGRRDALDRWS
jgi:acetyl/propionyl-CoA carboxylase alpha subunit